MNIQTGTPIVIVIIPAYLIPSFAAKIPDNNKAKPIME